MTMPSLAFAATVTRSALSAEQNCHWRLSSNSTDFDNMVFYESILKTVKSWDEADRKSLLRWWNSIILSHVHISGGTGSFGDTPAPGSSTALMIRQAVGMGDDPH